MDDLIKPSHMLCAGRRLEAEVITFESYLGTNVGGAAYRLMAVAFGPRHRLLDAWRSHGQNWCRGQL